VSHEKKNGDSKGKEEKETTGKKLGPEHWRQRMSDIPRLRWCIILGLLILLLLTAGAVAFGIYRANQAIDIGTLIIDGKYVNTITSCGTVQGYAITLRLCYFISFSSLSNTSLVLPTWNEKKFEIRMKKVREL